MRGLVDERARRGTARNKKRMRDIKRGFLKKVFQPSVRSRGQDWVMKVCHMDTEDWGKDAGARRYRTRWQRKKNGQGMETHEINRRQQETKGEEMEGPRRKQVAVSLHLFSFLTT